ncbi:Ankyrin repeat domain-containing protein 45 [Acipenser ruthenus]|uniref:Ankyrin repeat domain-containing protein 45 n=1 Tax=Acipenser ruthenus TaxID=7906 RepID=A0A444UD11_ACIRT|nr:Ankyrin repeat domain-containing protein 45 [Acipenser ruthenus]
MEPKDEDTNPVLACALSGDIEGLQKWFENPEDPHHEQAIQMLQETDHVGRRVLFTACMLGRSDVVRELVRYGSDVNETTLREAKQSLQMLISHIRDTIADPEKVQGKLNKEDKHTCLNTCLMKSDWIQDAKDPTIGEFVEQKKQLQDTLNPILSKLTVPGRF